MKHHFLLYILAQIRFWSSRDRPRSVSNAWLYKRTVCLLTVSCRGSQQRSPEKPSRFPSGPDTSWTFRLASFSYSLHRSSNSQIKYIIPVFRYIESLLWFHFSCFFIILLFSPFRLFLLWLLSFRLFNCDVLFANFFLFGGSRSFGRH
jgi:hypothetical protein